jgi:DNA-binding MarR family transcriptional regulator
LLQLPVNDSSQHTAEESVSRKNHQAAPELIVEAFETTIALYNRMRAFADDIHEHLGISGAMRGVLRELDRMGPQTVPAMARRRPVSRQHIQVLVNQLHELGLVETVENPNHKRSRKVQLTESGQSMVNEIWERELAVIREHRPQTSDLELREAIQTMQQLRTSIEEVQRSWSVRGSHEPSDS